MRRFLHIVMFVIALAVMSAPPVYAQRHHGAHGNDNRTERRKESARPASDRNNGSGRGHSGRPGVGGVSNRPSAGSGRPSSGNRPSIGGNQGNNRPTGNRPDVGNRPGNGNHERPSVGGSQRPGMGSSHRPGVGGNHRPGVGNRPSTPPPPSMGHRPGVGHYPAHRPAPRPPVIAPPHRPYRPVIARPHYRPAPPPAWRPRRGIPVIRGILGLTFGAAFNVSLDYLYNSGYTVDGYGNNIVYLRNVPAMNYIWTDGALYYGNGGLDASSFYYSTPVYDLTRYNAVYSNLVNVYGVPVTVSNSGGVMSSTWFGGNNGYITLSFGAGPAGRFLTTLTLGM